MNGTDHGRRMLIRLLPFVTGAFLLAETIFALPLLSAQKIGCAGFLAGQIMALALLAGLCLWSRRKALYIEGTSCCIALLSGLYNLYQNSFGDGSEVGFLILSLVVLVLTFAIMRNYGEMPRWLFIAVTAAIVLLMAANVAFGTEVNGAKNWIRIKGISIQPAELVKALLIIQGAASCRNPRRQAIYIGSALMTCGSLVLFHDLGNLCVIFVTLQLMIFLLYDDRRLSFLIAATTIAAFVAVLSVSTYARFRFFAWGHALDDITSQQGVAIKSVLLGGLRGLGFGDSLITGTGVTNMRNDIALAGLQAMFGSPLLWIAMLAYSGLILRAAWNRGLYASSHLLLMQSAVTIFTQVILNYAGSIDLLPFTGVVAPYVSQGGSAFICFGVVFGLILSAQAQALPSARNTTLKRLDRRMTNLEGRVKEKCQEVKRKMASSRS